MAKLPSFFWQQFEDENGVPYSGYKLHFFEAGTTNYKDIFQDADGNVAYDNPCTLNAKGLPANNGTAAPVRLDNGLYDVQLALGTDTNPPASPIETITDVGSSTDTIGTVDTIAELKALSEGAFNMVTVIGYYDESDIIEDRVYYWDENSTDSDNGGTVITPDTSDGTGRWILKHENILSAKWFGAYGDGSNAATNDTALSNLLTALSSGGTLRFSKGTYSIATNLSIDSDISVLFEEGSLITAASSITLTIDGDINAQLSKFIDTNITLDLATNNKGLTVYPEWFGAVGDGSTNNDTAISKAISSGNKVVFGNKTGNYIVTSSFNVKSNLEIDLNGATITSDQTIIFNFPSGTQDNVKFRSGTLTTTSVSASSDRGLIDANTGSTVSNVIIQGIIFNSTGADVNGVLFKVSDNGYTNLGLCDDVEVRNCEFNTGRMGVELVNNQVGASITGITTGGTTTIQTGAPSGYFVAGRSLLIQDVTGTGGIDTLLNNRIFEIVSESNGDIVINYAGTSVNSTGMAWSSGGKALDFRYTEIKVRDCDFVQCGTIAFGIGVSLSGPGGSCDISNNVFRDTTSKGIENVGACNSTFNDNKFVLNTGDPFSFSGSTNMIGNIIHGNTCEGRAEGSVLYRRQVEGAFSNNYIDIFGDMDVTTCRQCQIYGNTIKSKATSALLVDGSPNNMIYNNVLDNSDSTSNFATLRFNGASTTGNLAWNITLISGTGGSSWDEATSASGNNLREFRTSRSARFSTNLVRTDIPDNATSGLGGTSVSSQFTNVLGTSMYQAYTRYTSSRTNILIKHLTATATSGQPGSVIRCRYSGRTGNTVQGGSFEFYLGSFNDYDATPVFVQSGTAVTPPALSYDGSGYPTWTIALFSNDELIVGCEVESEDASKLLVTTS